MNVYWTADTHFQMPGILSATDRGKHFSSIDEHDNYIIDQINKICGKEDILFIVGDFGKKSSFAPILERFITRDVRLVIGNHDQSECSMQFLRHSFKQAEHILEWKQNGERIYMCHYCMTTWPGSFRKTRLLYGHSHAHLNKWIAHFHPRSRMLDVGLDSAKELLGDYRPFTYEEVLKFTDKVGDSPDIYKGVVDSVELFDRCESSGFSLIIITFDFDFGEEFVPSYSGRGDWNHVVYVGNEKTYFTSSKVENGKCTTTIGLNRNQTIPQVGDKITWRF